MANIVVKKADGTTNYTFTALSAAPGDGGFAQWRGEGSMPSVAANLRVKSRWNGPKSGRQVEVSGNFPFVTLVNGVDTVVSQVPIRFSATVPTNMPSSFAADAAAVMANTLASQIMKDVISTGFAPT